MFTQRGFTLIELVVTVAVIAIVITMAAPSFNAQITRQKLNASAREMMMALNQARSQAAVMRGNVAVCPSKTNTDSDFTKDECAAAVIPGYSSMDNATKTNVQNNRVFQGLINTKVTVLSTSATSVLFNSIGGVAATTTFRLCAAGEQRIITVSLLGNVTQTTGTC